MGLVTVDCRKIDTAGTREFISLLHKSQQAIAARAPSMSYYCHLLYAFLQESKVSACSLLGLISLLDNENSFIPSRSKFLSEVLTSLNDKGMIMFLKNQLHLEKSWIIVNTETLLKNINVCFR